MIGSELLKSRDEIVEKGHFPKETTLIGMTDESIRMGFTFGLMPSVV